MNKKLEIEEAIKRELHELIILYSCIHMCEIHVSIVIDIKLDDHEA